MFSLHYIKTGEIPIQFSEDFSVLFDRRQFADYDLDSDFPQDEVEHLVTMAERFYNCVRQKYA